MNILIIGACSKTGKKLIARALRHGHYITAVVDNPDKLQLFDDNLKVVDKGGFYKSIDGFLDKQHAVVNILCRNKLKLSKKLKTNPELLMQDIVQKISDYPGTKRLLVVNARNYIRKKQIHKNNEIITNSGLDWTIVHPARLIDKPKTGKYKISLRLIRNPFVKVSHADVADFVINNIENRNLIGKSVSIRY